MRVYILEKIKKSRKDKKRLRVNFVAHRSILKLVGIMGDMVIEIICARIQESGGKYSLIVDRPHKIPIHCYTRALH